MGATSIIPVNTTSLLELTSQLTSSSAVTASNIPINQLTSTIRSPSTISTPVSSPRSTVSINIQVNQYINPQQVFQKPLSVSSHSSDEDFPLLEQQLRSQVTSKQASPTPILSSTKKLAPDRPEVVWQAYIKERDTWLAQNPYVKLRDYRRHRGLSKVLKKSLLDWHRGHMPLDRRDLTGKIIPGKPNWTSEEVMAWLDHEEIRGEQVYQETKALASKNNGIPIVETIREIMTRVY